MRVIAGAFKGRRLVAPKGSRTVRPTTDRVKESVFSILREQVIDADFLDLCAGTGSMGIEALSRGAKQVTFLERDPRCIRIIEQNLRTCGLPALPHTRCFDAAQKPTVSAHLLRRDAVKGISYLQKQAAVFRIIYFDPPY
ncbi:MAG: 16S rRNA (guanine(966)-N(2))-methyltransferase RsmD, partial [Proteobacteria bacterium]|nr:16S rRNA (guanine(966)-N(2))-methyltransferase RsmD [Pseudomonadota bacterium]